MPQQDTQKPPKRGKIKRRLTLLLAIVIALAIAFVVLTKSQLMPYQVSKYLNEHMLADSRFEFSCQRITGNLVNRVVLHDPIVRFHGLDASYNVFRADEISIDYSILGVFRLNLIVHDLQLRNVGLQIRQDRDGHVILPVPVEGKITQETGAFAPRVDVQRFVIDGLHLYFGGGENELAVRNVNLQGAYRLERGVGRIRIDRGNAFVLGSETPVQKIEMDLYHEKNTVRVQDFSVRLGQSFIMANGNITAGGFDRLQFIFNPVVLEELHALGVIPNLKGELGGDATLHGGVDSLSISGKVTGTGFGMAVNNLDFGTVVMGNQVAFDRLAGEVYGASVDGKFWYRWGENEGFGYNGEFQDLDLSSGFLPDSGLPGMDVNGSGSLVWDGDKRYTISAELDSARIDNYDAGSGVFEAVWNDDFGLRIGAVQFERPGYNVEGSGFIDAEGNTDILFEATGDDFAYFWDYASIPPVSGTVSVAGKLSGPIRNLRINLNGTVEDAEYLFARVDSASVQAEVRDVGGDDVSARVDVDGRSIFLADHRLESPHLLIETGRGTTEVRDFSFSMGDTFATMHFEVSPEGDDTSVLFKHVEFALPQQLWRNSTPSTLIVGEGELRIDSLVFTSGTGEVGVDGGYSEREETVNLVGWGEQFELGLLRDALGLPIQLNGNSDFHLGMSGRIDSPEVDLTIDVGTGVVDSLWFDSLRLRADLGRDRWRLSDLLVVTGGDSLSGSGWWAVETSPFAIFAGGDSLRPGLDRPFQISVTCQHYPIPAVMTALHTAAPLGLGGLFTGRALLENTPTDPNVLVEGTVEPRVADGRSDVGPPRPGSPTATPSTSPALLLPPTSIRLDLRDGVTNVSEVSIGGGISATLTGVLPVGLDLTEGLQPRLDEPVRLELDVASADIAALAAYTTRLSSLSGSADGQVTVDGSLARPSFGGRMTFDNCAVRLADLDETYTEIDASVIFDDEAAELTSIRGKSRGEQAFSGSGSVEFDGFRPSDYRLDVTFTDFWITRKPDFETLVDGDVAVTTYHDADRRIPNITGKLAVKHAEILYTFESGGGRPPAVTRPTASPGWICSIDIDAHKNLWVRNPDMYVELGGQLILKRDNSGLYLRGDLSALRGSYTVYNNKFYVVEGSLDFSAADGIRPEVYINAYTPHRVEDGQERRIYLTLRWLRDKKEPEIQLSYDEPGYYESDLWRMLGGTDIAGGLAANTLEKLLNQQMSGMTIYVDRRAMSGTGTGTPEQQMMIGVGKYLWEDLYLSYRQGITFTADQVVEAEYRLRDMIYIRSGIIRYSNPRYVGSILRNTDEYNLDVKFRWEY
jgi:hypothetical protein